jgi:hypothetical protein
MGGAFELEFALTVYMEHSVLFRLIVAKWYLYALFKLVIRVELFGGWSQGILIALQICRQSFTAQLLKNE